MQNELLDFQIQIQKYSFDFCEERRDTIIDIMQRVVRKRVGVIGSGAAGLQVAFPWSQDPLMIDLYSLIV